MTTGKRMFEKLYPEMKEEWALLERFNEVLKRQPDNVSILLEKGKLCTIELEYPDEGIPALEHAAALAPTNTEVLFWLAKAYFHGVGDYDRVEEVLRRALLIDNNRAECHDLLADAVSNHHLAKIHLQKAAELEPSWFRVRVHLASLLASEGQYDQAEQQVVEALRLWEISEAPVPCNDFAEYYEFFVTGRIAFGRECFERQLEKIRAERRKHEGDGA